MKMNIKNVENPDDLEHNLDKMSDELCTDGKSGRIQVDAMTADDAVLQIAKDVESWNKSDKYEYVTGLAVAVIKDKASGELQVTASCSDFVNNPGAVKELVEGVGVVIGEDLMTLFCQNEDFSVAAKAIRALQTYFVVGLGRAIPENDRTYVINAMDTDDDKDKAKKGNKNGN